ncbi:MAG: hypothetical protein FWG87_07355 [Defluviitaleaceae bacterium]|nr:hypothetical protein [Defluviitaleaceae bacterium]
MKKREQILRIRPFNMANFSSGAAVMAFYALLNVLFSLPVTLLLWSGLAVSLKKEDGKLNYFILERRLDRIIFPICVLCTILTIILCINSLSFYSWDEPDTIVYAVFASIIPLGMYLPISFSARLLDKTDRLTRGKWFLLTLAFAVLMLVVGFVMWTFLTQ